MLKRCSISCTSSVLELKVSRILPSHWHIIKLFNGEHRAKVIVHCVGHVAPSFFGLILIPFYSPIDI